MQHQANFQLRDQSLEVGVIIPSYNELPRDLLWTLYSLALQTGIEEVRMGVFVIINNAPDEKEEIKNINTETHELIASLIDPQKPAPTLSEEKDDFGDSQATEVELYRTIREKRLQICLVDAFSVGHAIEDCNVGRACQTVTQYIFQYVREDGYMLRTDADCFVNSDYVRSGLAEMKSDESLGAVTGYFSPVFDDHRLQILHRIAGLLHDSVELAAANSVTRQTHNLLSGSNIFVRVKALKDVQGFREIPAAEDLELSLALLTHGYKINKLAALNIGTRARISERTPKGAGFGQWIKEIAGYINNPSDLPIDTPESQLLQYQLARQVDELIANNITLDEFLLKFREYGTEFGINFSDEEITRIYDEAKRYATFFSSFRSHYIRMLFEQKAREKYPKIGIAQAVGRAWDYIYTVYDGYCPDSSYKENVYDFLGLYLEPASAILGQDEFEPLKTEVLARTLHMFSYYQLHFLNLYYEIYGLLNKSLPGSTMDFYNKSSQICPITDDIFKDHLSHLTLTFLYKLAVRQVSPQIIGNSQTTIDEWLRLVRSMRYPENLVNDYIEYVEKLKTHFSGSDPGKHAYIFDEFLAYLKIIQEEFRLIQKKIQKIAALKKGELPSKYSEILEIIFN